MQYLFVILAICVELYTRNNIMKNFVQLDESKFPKQRE